MTIQQAKAEKLAAWKQFGYGSPEHRAAQKRLAQLLRKKG